MKAREVTYDEALKLLGVTQLFDYWNDEDSNYASDYESERDYFEGSLFQYHDGDLTIGEEHNISGFVIDAVT